MASFRFCLPVTGCVSQVTYQWISLSVAFFCAIAEILTLHWYNTQWYNSRLKYRLVLCIAWGCWSVCLRICPSDFQVIKTKMCKFLGRVCLLCLELQIFIALCYVVDRDRQCLCPSLTRCNASLLMIVVSCSYHRR